MNLQQAAFVSTFAPVLRFGPLPARNASCNVCCAAAPPSAPRTHNVAIEAARRGDFAAAGQALRSSAKAVAAEVDDDDDMKSQARRDILNQISLDKLSVDSDGGIVELYEAMKSSGLLSAYGSFGGFGQSSASKAISVQKLVEDAGVHLAVAAR
jgi:hypothetical protein